ncbi:MAG: transketolase [Bacteroidales bacterium]|nr:transketolase [Bacteroidales bacterium]
MQSWQTSDPEQLLKIANKIRISIVESLTEAGSGHIGGSLDLADIFSCLYFCILKNDPKNPGWSDRDRLVLSIGHVVPVLYATLAHAGYFPIEELNTLRKLNSRLQGHPARDRGLPGIELSAGSLGQGLSVGTGMALAGKSDHRTHRIFVILGDGELQEGSVWEAAMSAAHYHLDNLIAIVDRNGLQIDGRTENVMKLEPLMDKWRSFGWSVFSIDGHNPEQLLETVKMIQLEKNRPSVILANTCMGKGIRRIEGDPHWHGKVPNKKESIEFIEELKNKFNQ